MLPRGAPHGVAAPKGRAPRGRLQCSPAGPEAAGDRDEKVIPGSVRAPRPNRQSRGGSKPRRKRLQGRAAEIGMNNPSRLRILGGTARGRRLDSPEVFLRPMMGKVREALFSTLFSMGLFSMKDRPVRALDCFAGSGSVGLEALSRGADSATFLDFAKDCVKTIEKNVEWCDFAGRGKAVLGDVMEVFADPAAFGIDHSFELITITPPYEEVSYQALIKTLGASPLLGDDTIVVIEYPVELGCLPRVMVNGKLVGLRNRRYGRTVLGIYIANPTGLYDMEPRHEEFLAF